MRLKARRHGQPVTGFTFRPSLEVFQEFLRDFVDFAAGEVTVQENRSFWEGFAFVCKGKGMSEVGAEGDGCLRLHHVCPRAGRAPSKGVLSCSCHRLCPRRTTSFPPHPRLPARAQPSGTGWRLPQGCSLPWFLAILAPSSAPSTVLYARQSHTLKPWVLIRSVLYTKTATLVNEERSSPCDVTATCIQIRLIETNVLKLLQMGESCL